MTALRNYQTVVEVLTGDNSNAPVRVYQVVVEILVLDTAGSSYDDSLTIAGTAAVTLTPGTGWPQSLTIAGTSALTGLDGFRYQDSLTVAATASVTEVDSLGISVTLTVAGIADIDLDFVYLQNLVVTCAAISDVSVAVTHNKFAILTIAASAAFFSPGGAVYEIQRSIEGLSAIAVLDGFSYEKTLQLDCIAEIDLDFEYFKNESLTIDALASVDVDSQYSVNATLAVAGTAGVTINSTIDFVLSMTLSSQSVVFFENIYDVLLVSAVISDITVAVDHQQRNSQNPAATGSISVSAQCVFARIITQSLVLTQAVTLKKPTAFNTQSLVFTQQVTVSRVSNKTVTHTLTMTHEAIAVRAIAQSLTLTQSATCMKVLSRTVSQTLAFTQTAARNTVISRTLSDTLVYNPPNLQRLPIIGSQNQTGNHQFEYYIPTVNVVLVPRKCLIILGVPSQTVVLPCPIWGDSQSYQGTIDLKRAMTGVTYTYVKKAQTQKLHYSFELWTYKYLELRQFFIDHSEEVMMLQNHNSETWLVHLVNNPIEFTAAERWQPKGEKYTVTLEFEGVKIGG